MVADACLACGAALDGAARFAGRDRMLGTPGEFTVLVCPACGSGTTRPELATEELGALYPEVYGPYAEPQGLLATVSKAIRAAQGARALRRFPLAAAAGRSPGRGLDVGCGRGDLAAEFVKRGWRMTGVEP